MVTEGINLQIMNPSIVTSVGNIRGVGISPDVDNALADRVSIERDKYIEIGHEQN